MVERYRGVALAVLVSVAFLTGCAFGTRNTTLIYPPSSASGQTSIAHADTKPIPKNIQIVVKPFTDQRSDKKVVGTVRNGFGARTADVIPTNSVADWVTQAVTTELKNDGYNVTSGTPSENSESTSAIVSGEILNVFCDMYFSYTGQVSLITRVNKDGKELLNKHYAGEGSAGLAVAGTGGIVCAVLGACLIRCYKTVYIRTGQESCCRLAMV